MGLAQPPSPSRTIHTVTLVRGSPRSRRTASSMGMLTVDSPLICTMRSPFFTPARPAGVSGMGFMTVSCPSRIAMTMPRPPKAPEVDVVISL